MITCSFYKCQRLSRTVGPPIFGAPFNPPKKEKALDLLMSPMEHSINAYPYLNQWQLMYPMEALVHGTPKSEKNP